MRAFCYTISGACAGPQRLAQVWTVRTYWHSASRISVMSGKITVTNENTTVMNKNIKW